MDEFVTKKEVERNHSLDLLRILLMLMIICHHFCFYGLMNEKFISIEFDWWNNNIILNKLFVCFAFPGGNVGNGLFFALSGYFLFNKQEVSVNKIIKMYFQALFYILISFAVYFISSYFGFSFSTFTIKQLVGALVDPLTSSSWWFLPSYIILYLMHPVLNNFIRQISQMKLGALILFLYITLIVLPFILACYPPLFGVSKAVVFYLLGCYVKRNSYNQKNVWIYLLFSILIWCAMAFCQYPLHSQKLNGLVKCFFFLSIEQFLVFFCCYFLLIFFSNIKLKNKYISKLAKCCFGIYLLHESFVIRELLWKMICKPFMYYGKSNFILVAVLFVVIIFLLALIVDGVRILVEKKMFSKIENTFKEV